jgi:hypothetical protein
MTLHIGVLGFATFLCYLLIGGFLLRSLSAKFPDSTFSKAVAYIY